MRKHREHKHGRRLQDLAFSMEKLQEGKNSRYVVAIEEDEPQVEEPKAVEEENFETGELIGMPCEIKHEDPLELESELVIKVRSRIYLIKFNLED